MGASEGIGLELTILWLQQGHEVLASSRNAEQSIELTRLQTQYPTQLQCLNIDVTDANDCQTKAEQAWALLQGIDLWFYNVGAYKHMPTSEWSWQDFVIMNQANYLGAVALMLPLQKLFQAQGHGQWVWNASLASYFGLPYGGGYSAPKAALVNLAESLQPELAQQGIDLQIINHGFVRTRLTAKNTFDMPALLDTDQAAVQINKAIMKSKRFEIHFPFTVRITLHILRILPYRLSLAITKKMLKAPQS